MRQTILQTVRILVATALVAGCTSGHDRRFKLEREGDVEMIVEMSVPSLMDRLASSADGGYRAVMDRAKMLNDTTSMEFVDLFVRTWHTMEQRHLASVFATQMLRDSINTRSSDDDVARVLRGEVVRALDQTEAIFRSRLEKSGYSDCFVQPSNRRSLIMVQARGVTDCVALRQLMMSTGELEFWETYNTDEVSGSLMRLDAAIAEEQLGREYPLLSLLNTSGGYLSVVGRALPSDTATVNAMLHSETARRLLPADLRLMWGAKPLSVAAGLDGSTTEYAELYAIRVPSHGSPLLTSAVLTSSSVDRDDYGHPVVSMQMNTTGARIWAGMTRANQGRAIAITLDGHVYTAPRVMSEILGGRCQISGNFTIDDCRQIVDVLTSGTLPAPVRIVQENSYTGH